MATYPRTLAQAATTDLPGTYAPLTALPFGDDSVRIAARPSFGRVSTIFTQAESGLDSLFSPWIIRVDDKISSPLGTFYLYFSTNHSSGLGGIGLAYADHPAGPWTVYGSNPIWQDTTAAFQTENAAVLWDPDNSRLIMYYKADSSFHTYAATSTDGVAWTRYGQVLTKPSGLPGDGMTGYLKPFRIGDTWHGYHFIGGGDLAVAAISHSQDGLYWKTDPRPLTWSVDVTGSNTRRFSWPHSYPFWYRGSLWLLGLTTNFTSGGVPGAPTQFVAPLSPDLRSLTAKMSPVMSTMLDGETTVQGASNMILYQGYLHGYYVSNGGTSPTGGGSMGYFRGAAA